MMKPLGFEKDTNAWITQVWASFIVAMSASTIGIIYFPVDVWVKGYMAISFAFSISSTFTLAKTIRDNHEANRLTSRIDEARVEKILAEHHPLK